MASLQVSTSAGPTIPAHYKPRPKDENGEVVRNDDRPTPRDLFESFNAEFDFRVDACASSHNAKLPYYFDERLDGLKQDWAAWRRVWCNPPYGAAIPIWISKAIEEAKRGCTSVLLVPASTSTAWFRELVWNRCELRFIDGKIKFVGCKNVAPFHSMLLVYGPNVKPCIRITEKVVYKWPNKVRARCWSTYDMQKNLIFDPAAVVGGWFDRKGKVEPMNIPTLFFGCNKGRYGHEFWRPNVAPHYGKSETYPRCPDFAEIGLNFDGRYITGEQRRQGKIFKQGEAVFFYIKQLDVSVVSWADSSVDLRPSSNSAYIARGEWIASDLISHGDALYPSVASRQPTAIEVVATHRWDTLREAYTANYRGIGEKRSLADADSDLSLFLDRIKDKPRFCLTGQGRDD